MIDGRENVGQMGIISLGPLSMLMVVSAFE